MPSSSSDRIPKPRYMNFVYSIANKLLDANSKIRVVSPTRGIVV